MLIQEPFHGLPRIPIDPRDVAFRVGAAVEPAVAVVPVELHVHLRQVRPIEIALDEALRAELPLDPVHQLPQ